ncbi:MAG: metal-dependent hydrolase [Eubacteriales bacterium]|nr:metal-dependent hydrolase [Eubacteriales bacterium]
MMGKTHMVCGTACALCVLQPTTIREWVICTGAAAIGAVISDIDVTTSDSRETLNKITFLSVLIAIAVCCLEYQWHLGIMRNFNRESNLFRLVVGFAVFLGICTFGKNQPHRSFMHSFAGLASLSIVLYLVYPPLAAPFAIAMLSHIMLDILNRRKVRLFYPLRGGLCLRLCSANGLVNKAFLAIGSAVFAVYSGMLLFTKIKGFLG